MTPESVQKPVQYIRKEHVEVTCLDDELILLNTGDYTVTKLNDIGGFCWACLQTTHTVESLLQAVDAEFDLEGQYDSAKKEIEAFLSELVRCDLIDDVH